MKKRKKEELAERSTSILTLFFIFLSLFASSWLLFSYLLEGDFFRIRKLEIISTPKEIPLGYYLRKEIEDLIKNQYANNWLILYSNIRNLEDILIKKTNLNVKSVEIYHLNPLKGVVVLKITLRKPIANLMERNYF